MNLKIVTIDRLREFLNKLSKVATSGKYSDLSGAPNLATVATSGKYSDLSGAPNLATVATSGKYSDLSGAPNLATVATSGKYSDLSGAPNLATVATSGKYSDLSGAPNLATVATSGKYSDLSGAPTEVSQFINDAGYAKTTDIPVLDSKLSQTSTNGIQNKIVTLNMNGVLCTTSAEIPTKTVDIPGFVLYEGAIVRILFKGQNTANSPQLNVNGTGGIPIVFCRNPDYIHLSKWDANTIMELIYDGTYWIVMGNPVVMTRSFTTYDSYNNFIVSRQAFKYANGLLIQYGVDLSNTEVYFPIEFTTTSSFSLSALPVSSNRGTRASYVENETSAKQFKILVYDAEDSHLDKKPIKWTAIGYSIGY